MKVRLKFYIGIGLIGVPIVTALINGLVYLASIIGWLQILGFLLWVVMIGTGSWLMWSAAND
jgi:hypothetical protein